MINNSSHKRKNILTGEWVLVCPNRLERPWQGESNKTEKLNLKIYDPDCYLCPGNYRANGERNKNYSTTYSFINDYSSLELDQKTENSIDNLLEARTEKGICKVLCYSPNHSLTMSKMNVDEIVLVIDLWIEEYKSLGLIQGIKHIQIFENKGEMMGCSNPHPHGQVWAQETIPDIVKKKDLNQKHFFLKNKVSLLKKYLEQELSVRDRIVIENNSFVCLVPFWATWPYETMIIPKKQKKSILELTKNEIVDYARILKNQCQKFDKLFGCAFPYSMGIHQSPTDKKENKHWHMHMSFYPPLLRSSKIKKFMVGYEMFAGPQRDITPEFAAKRLREC